MSRPWSLPADWVSSSPPIQKGGRVEKGKIGEFYVRQKKIKRSEISERQPGPYSKK